MSVPDYSKRVYQGVRVKHTVKDLLAEKRSRQTSTSRYSVSAFVRLSSPHLSRGRSVGVIVDLAGPPAPPLRSLRPPPLTKEHKAGLGEEGRGPEPYGGGRMDGLCKVGSPHLPGDKPAIVASERQAVALATAAWRRLRAAAGAAFHAAAVSACPHRGSAGGPGGPTKGAGVSVKPPRSHVSIPRVSIASSSGRLRLVSFSKPLPVSVGLAAQLSWFPVLLVGSGQSKPSLRFCSRG